MSKQSKLLAALFALSVTLVVLSASVDRDLIKTEKRTPTKPRAAKATRAAIPGPAPVTTMDEKRAEEKPELKAMADCIERQEEKRLVLDTKDKDGYDLFFEFAMNRIRLCKEVDVSKICSHEQILDGKFVEGEDDDVYRHHFHRGQRICGYQKHTHTLQGLLAR